MKKLLCIGIMSFTAINAMAQAQGNSNYNNDDMSGWVIDANAVGGLFTQSFTANNPTMYYPNALNTSGSGLKFNNGYAYGGDAQLGFFFGKKKHWGIGSGFMYLEEQGFVGMNNFHVEYQSTDGQGNTFRQLITSNNISENVRSTNLNIPLVLKYKTRCSKHWGFSADAGALFNTEMQNNYKANSSFNYEAIYKFVTNANGTTSTVYDNSPMPGNTDWLITQSQFLKNNPDGNAQQYFNTLHSEGYNVGLGVNPSNKTGKVTYASGSIGFIAQPSIDLYLSDYVALNFGVLYIYQTFKNNALSGYRVTDAVGSYNSMLNTVTQANDQVFGLNIGARFFFARRSTMAITAVDQFAPSACGMCDGSMVLHGLPAGKTATVNYKMNDSTITGYTGTVDQNGTLKVTGLCGGAYSDISANIGRKSATTSPVTIENPVLSVTENSSDPSSNGACNGSITINGLDNSKTVAVNYAYNGAPQAYEGYISSGKSLSIPNLCAGSYTDISVATGSCAAKITDVALNAPPPSPAPVAPVVNQEKIDISTPILFDFNKATIHGTYDPILEEATKEVDETSNTYIRVDGHTDAVGSQKYNMGLSLRRAMSIKKYLTKKGVPADKIRIYGHGKLQPAAPNKTAAGRAKNRRAVMHLENSK